VCSRFLHFPFLEAFRGEMSHKKVFEDVVGNAIKMADDNQAINFACTQLECMYQFTTCKKEVKEMCSLAVEKFYKSERFRGNDHVLRIFQVLIRVSQTMGAKGIYEEIEKGGYFKNSLKFHILWAEAEAARKDKKRFKEIWEIARQRIPSRTNVDAAFRDIAANEFPDVPTWFEDDDPERTLNIFAPSTKSRRRSSVAFLERAALPAPSAPITKKLHFMSKTNPLRTCIVDRDDGYLGISGEEYRMAKTDDLADMDITTMQPIEEEAEMEVEKEERESVESKKMRVYSPVRQPLVPKQDVKASSPLVAHTSFTSNFYNKAMNAFSETMKVEEVVTSPMDKPSDATYEVHRTPSSTVVTSSTAPSASRESFAIFLDEDEEKEDEPVSMPPPPTKPKGLSARPSVTPSTHIHQSNLGDDPFDDNEPTVAGFNRGKGDRFLTSTPAIKGFEMENEEPNFWMEGGGSGGKLTMEDLDLSVIGKEGEGEREAEKISSVPTIAPSGAFARKRKSFGGGVVGDKARSSIGPKGSHSESDNAALAKEMNCMKIGGDEKINPWDREIRGAIMNQCSTPVNRHDLTGNMKQPRNGQKMELGGEVYSLEHLIGEGGFAKVFLCTNEKKEMLAMKYETPSCEWEVYILEVLRKRVRDVTVMDSLMQVTDAFIYQNCSLILSEYLPMGTLLQSTTINADPHWSIVVYLGMQMAKVLKDVHAANIVHGDAKPDNWMVIEKINEDASIEELLDARCVRLIDWGRAIDMKALGGRSLYGRAGTDKFDCIEMCEGRPWTYHPDFYAFCATIYVLHMKDYMSVAPGTNGRYAPVKAFKRRLVTLALWSEIFDECFNVSEGDPLPSWSLIHDKLKGYFVENMDRSAWKDAVRKFNKSLQS
ncbi:hypothetical protein PMAYCL1PPCAC_23625, partial [Pristionchus mayeri]